MFIHPSWRTTRIHPALLPGWIIFATLSLLILPGAEPATTQPVAEQAVKTGLTNPAVRQIGPGLFQLGDVSLDRSNRTVRFPASVNLRDGHIEYVVVTATGKTHESLLRTTAEPMHLQLAFLLLGAQGAGTHVLPEDPAISLPGGKVEVEVSWMEDTGPRRFRAEEFVQDRKAGAPASRGNWIYTGSRLREDGFAAQLDGSIISLITDPDALINSPRPGREDDDNWLVRTNLLPPLHAPVEVSIRLVR